MFRVDSYLFEGDVDGLVYGFVPETLLILRGDADWKVQSRIPVPQGGVEVATGQDVVDISAIEGTKAIVSVDRKRERRKKGVNPLL